MVDSYDPEEEVPEEFTVKGLTAKPRRRYRKKLILQIAYEIKAKLGTPIYNDANMLTVRHLARKSLLDLKVRPTWVAMMIPGIIGVVFTPSEEEVAGARTLNSYTHRAMRQRLHRELPPPGK
jgi:hypothetical protein